MFIVDFNLLNWTDSETNKIRVTWSGLSTWLSGIKQKQHNSSCTDFTIGPARKKKDQKVRQSNALLCYCYTNQTFCFTKEAPNLCCLNASNLFLFTQITSQIFWNKYYSSFSAE